MDVEAGTCNATVAPEIHDNNEDVCRIIPDDAYPGIFIFMRFAKKVPSPKKYPWLGNCDEYHEAVASMKSAGVDADIFALFQIQEVEDFFQFVAGSEITKLIMLGDLDVTEGLSNIAFSKQPVFYPNEYLLKLALKFKIFYEYEPISLTRFYFFDPLWIEKKELLIEVFSDRFSDNLDELKLVESVRVFVRNLTLRRDEIVAITSVKSSSALDDMMKDVCAMSNELGTAIVGALLMLLHITCTSGFLSIVNWHDYRHFIKGNFERSSDMKKIIQVADIFSDAAAMSNQVQGAENTRFALFHHHLPTHGSLIQVRAIDIASIKDDIAEHPLITNLLGESCVLAGESLLEQVYPTATYSRRILPTSIIEVVCTQAVAQIIMARARSSCEGWNLVSNKPELGALQLPQTSRFLLEQSSPCKWRAILLHVCESGPLSHLYRSDTFCTQIAFDGDKIMATLGHAASMCAKMDLYNGQNISHLNSARRAHHVFTARDTFTEDTTSLTNPLWFADDLMKMAMEKGAVMEAQDKKAADEKERSKIGRKRSFGGLDFSKMVPPIHPPEENKRLKVEGDQAECRDDEDDEEDEMELPPLPPHLLRIKQETDRAFKETFATFMENLARKIPPSTEDKPPASSEENKVIE